MKKIIKKEIINYIMEKTLNDTNNKSAYNKIEKNEKILMNK